MKRHWDLVALEAGSPGVVSRVERWRKVARNWLADYADKRARDFVSEVITQVAKLSKSARILDIGCGSGKWSLMLAERYSEVTAIDRSQEMIAIAKAIAEETNTKNLTFRVMDASLLNMPDETYDLVNCVTVLQHIVSDHSWQKAVQEIARVTRKGGYALLFEAAPNFVLKKRTPNLSIRSMWQYIEEFRKTDMRLTYWRAVDLSLPITYLGLTKYAASFNRRVYYFASEKSLLLPRFWSFLSKCSVLLARLIDYRLGETPLSLLSFGRIMLFQKLD